MDFLGMGQYVAKSHPQSSEGFSRRMGGIANVNYTYDRRYFIDASIQMKDHLNLQ